MYSRRTEKLRTAPLLPGSRAETFQSNVGYGESVLFVGSGGNGAERSFARRFDVSLAVSAVDLSEVARADFPDHNVRVFVTEDPRYSGD